MSNTKDAMNEQLGQAKILPLLVRLAIPATAAQLVNALYSIVDRMYIGHMPGDGTLALSGIGLTFPITMLIAAFSSHPAGQRAEVKAGCKPVHFSLDPFHIVCSLN